MRDGKTRTVKLKDLVVAAKAIKRRHHNEPKKPNENVAQQKEHIGHTAHPARRNPVSTRQSTDRYDSVGTEKTPTRQARGKPANNDTLQLAEAFQKTLRVNTLGTTSEECPILYVTRTALRTEIEHIKQLANPTNSNTPNQHNKMDNKPTGPSSPGYLPLRNLSSELDIAQTVQIQKEGDNSEQQTDMVHSETPKPARTGNTEPPHTTLESEKADPNNLHIAEASPYQSALK